MKFRTGIAASIFLASVAAISFQSCEHDSIPAPTSVKKWDMVPVKAIYEIPAPAGRTEEGEVTLELLSDNSLKYNFHIHNLSPSDALTAAHIHIGDAGTAGPVFINLNPIFSGSGSTGVVTNLRQGQIDSLLTKPVYFNAHSTQAPAGIVRAQLDKKIEFAANIALSGTNEVPPVTTTATGTAILRLTDDKTFYSKVTVSGIETLDTFTVSHIHRGAAGTNGPVRIFLANNVNDFGILKTAVLPDSLYNMVKNDPVYVNVHSKLRGAGIIRGQIR